MGELYKPTGVEAFDSLRGLQLVADTISNPDAKIDHVSKGVRELGSSALLGHSYLVTAQGIFVKRPERPAGSMVYLPGEMTLIGELNELRYLLDLEVPVDTLTLNFAQPEVWNIDPEEAEHFRTCQFQVPVLSMTTAMSAEIGDIL